MSQHNNSPELPVFQDCYEFVKRLFTITARFPKSTRFSFVARLENWSLEILEMIVQARYAPSTQKKALLQEINLKLEQMRLFSRLSQEMGLMHFGSYEYIIKELYNIGCQIGSWLKSLES